MAQGKGIFQKLSFLKGYSFLLFPVLICLVGLLVLIPAKMISGSLKKEMSKESISKGKTIQSLSRSTPSKKQWEVEQEYQQSYESDANIISALSIQSTQRELLRYKIFPESKDTSSLIFQQYGHKWQEVIGNLLSQFNARNCPTETELSKNVAGSSQFGSTRLNPAITDMICEAKAKSATVYANALDIAGYQFWNDYEYNSMKEAIEDCWYWQLGCWIIEDVLQSIGNINAGSSNVFESPVKRLVKVGFSVGSSTSSSGTTIKPSYVLEASGGLAESLTGRVCDNYIDVVHFHLVVLVRTDSILDFMKELCSEKEHKFKGFDGRALERSYKHNQITILESSINTINRESTEHQYYRYGNDAVLEVDLICEYIFNKKGYEAIKPKTVKEFLDQGKPQ